MDNKRNLDVTFKSLFAEAMDDCVWMLLFDKRMYRLTGDRERASSLWDDCSLTVSVFYCDAVT